MDRNILIIYIPLVLLVFLLQINPISSYFSQDDFFHLRIIMDKEFRDIPGFFVSSLEGQTFYRPISRETYNLVMYKLFDLNPLPFHMVNLGLIILNLVFMSKIIRNLTSSLVIVFFSGLIFSISSLHSIEIYYLPSVQTLLSTASALLSIIFFTKFIQVGNLNYLLASILFYSFALFCHESAIILPGILFLIYFFLKKEYKKLIFCMAPFAIVALIFFLSTSSITNLPAQEVYKPVFQFSKIFNTLGWYMLWSFGMPEMLVDFIGPKLALRDQFITWYSYYAKIVFPSLFITISLLLLIIWSLRQRILHNKLLAFFITAFFISISPFLFFPQHKFVYYLSFPIIWFSAALAIILAAGWRVGSITKLLSLIIILSFIIISYQTISLNTITHWAAKRAKAAEVLIAEFRERYPNPSMGSVFYITDDPDYPNIAKEWGSSSKQAFFILSGSDALQLLYRDPKIKVYYQANGLPNNIDKAKIINFMARFPY